MGVCVSGHVCVSFSQVEEVALNTYCQSLFHPLCNHLYSIHNCLLSKNPGNVSPLVTKMKSSMNRPVAGGGSGGSHEPSFCEPLFQNYEPLFYVNLLS